MNRRSVVTLLLFVFAIGFATTGMAEGPKVSAAALEQMAALKAVKLSKTPDQKKIDSRLFLGLLNQRKDARLSALPDFRFVKPEADGRVAVDIIVSGTTGVKPVLSLLEARGDVVKSTSFRHGRISARVSLDSLEPLAVMPEVRKVRTTIPAFTNKNDTSEGDVTHAADTARTFYGVLGNGVKIGVLSDGVDSLAALQASGDLPPVVDVLPGQAGSGDEGSAMLEIIYDLAPNADLAFATAFISEASFAQNILDLAAAGCDIIVDDIIYLDESPFQDGPVAQAVNTVTAAGVLYFSSAGNEGNAVDLTSGTWEGDFAPSVAADPGPLAGANLHDFGDGGNSILVEFGGGNPPLLIWAEHYDLTTGLASTDFDLYDMDGGLTTIFDASTDVQDGAGGNDFPIEFIGGGAFAGERLLIDLFSDGATSSRPMFNLILFRGELDDALATGGATRGHSAAAAAFSTAATPAVFSFDGVTPDGPFPGVFTTANESESFSSDGTRRIILDPAGGEITPGDRTSTGGVVRQKPDITAADGVSCSAPGFSTFYGTSAAAPHAAAIAGLLLSAVPTLTPAQIRTALESTAIDIEAGGIDSETGVGIVMADAALAFVGAAPAAFLVGGAPTASELAGDGDANIEIGEQWNLTIPVTNNGGITATAITGTLTSTTPGVSILAGFSSYADLAAAASGNNTTPFTFSTAAPLACGATIDFTLTIAYTGGPSPQTFDFSLQIGSAGAPVAYSYVEGVDPAVGIPDSPGANTPGVFAQAPLTVAGFVGNLFDVDFQFDGSACSNVSGSTTVGLNHTFVNDLEISLLSPGATNVIVINRTDGGGNNFCQTALDDESAGANIQTVLTASAPFTGNFTPNAPLSAFDGEDPNGIWNLGVVDYFIGDTGSIRSFTLTLTPAVCDAVAVAPILTATKTVAGSFTEGGAITYTIVITNTGTGAQFDNAGDEFTDTLPVEVTVGTPTASVGTVSGVGINPVTWNGSLLPGASVTITIPATINLGTAGLTVMNQGATSFDSDGNGTNDTAGLTDDPGVGGLTDPTSFLVAALAAAPFPANAALGPATLAGYDSCDVTVQPAATLLLPYFEVDPTGFGENTVVAITNASDTAIVAHVTVWSNWSFPVLDFNLYLTGYDVVTMSLRDLLVSGNIPNTGHVTSISPVGVRTRTDASSAASPVRLVAPYNPLAATCSAAQGGNGAVPGFLLSQIQSGLTGGPYSAGGVACGQVGDVSDNMVGYITFDTSAVCSQSLPTDAVYFATEIRWENQLVGDYIRLNDVEGV
ncbi:MAG: S8 family serine peptidase, partial [Thermoanaerobaculia bacterium]